MLLETKNVSIGDVIINLIGLRMSCTTELECDVEYDVKYDENKKYHIKTIHLKDHSKQFESNQENSIKDETQHNPMSFSMPGMMSMPGMIAWTGMSIPPNMLPLTINKEDDDFYKKITPICNKLREFGSNLLKRALSAETTSEERSKLLIEVEEITNIIQSTYPDWVLLKSNRV